jgi:hypothetical protein
MRRGIPPEAITFGAFRRPGSRIPTQAAQASATTMSSWSRSRQLSNVSFAEAVIFTLKLANSSTRAFASGKSWAIHSRRGDRLSWGRLCDVGVGLIRRLLILGPGGNQANDPACHSQLPRPPTASQRPA